MKRKRIGNKNFTRTAMRTHPTNNYMPMRGGIRL
jgi:hypothetical protein